MSLRPDLNNTYRDAFGQAAAHRGPSTQPAPVHPQDPNIRTTEVGAGDRAVAEARKRLLDPFNLSTPKDKPAASIPAKPSDDWSRLNAAFAARRAQAQAAAHARAAAAQREADRVNQLGRIDVPVSKDARARHPDWFEPSTHDGDGEV